jgi:hypothetical protein
MINSYRTHGAYSEYIWFRVKKFISKLFRCQTRKSDLDSRLHIVSIWPHQKQLLFPTFIIYTIRTVSGDKVSIRETKYKNRTKTLEFLLILHDRTKPEINSTTPYLFIYIYAQEEWGRGKHLLTNIQNLN